ncbi:MAG: cytochrome c oxidase subunit I [Beijerinckiaceae bacterium]
MKGPASAFSRHRRLQHIWSNPTGLSAIASVNHSQIGLRFMGTSIIFFLIGGVLAMLIRAQLATSKSPFMDHEAYSQVFTMHGTVMMFLFAIPFIEGLALYLLPKMLGSRELAFPRLGAFGYWCYLFGGMMLVGALFAGAAPNSGWFMYTPLSSKPYSPGVNSDVWLLGVTFVEISAIVAAVEIVATVLTMRAPGMALNKMPLFAWYMLVTAAMMLAGFPPLILGSILLEVERSFGWPFFKPELGGDPLLWQHLFWLFGHPEVYIIFLPAAGVVATILPAFVQRPIVGYNLIVAALIAQAFISFGIWAHHMFTVGIPHLALTFFSAASLLVVIPTSIQIFAWFATIWLGRLRYGLPMLWLAGFLFIFVLGGMTGVMLAIVPFNWQVHDTHFVVAHLHYVLVGGFVFPMIAAIYYWFPHVTGRMPNQRLGAAAFWLVFIGFNTTFFIMHLTGLIGMPRRIYTYPPALGWDLPNLISSVGGFVMSMGFAVMLIDLVTSWFLGRRAQRNPWRSETLEWATPRPPPLYNFASQPVVTDRTPLWTNPKIGAEIASGRHLLPGDAATRQETLGVEILTGEPKFVIDVPRPSWLPFLAALCLLLFFSAMLAKLYAIAPLGLLAALLVFLIWAWRTGVREDPAPVAVREGLALPRHEVAPHAPGWWGLSFTHFANGAFFLSLVFGYAYVVFISPGPAPPGFAPSAVLCGVLAGALLLAAVAAWSALWATRREARVTRAFWLLAAAVGGVAATVIPFMIGFAHVPDPRAHAFPAVVWACLLYAAFHAFVGAVMAVFTLAHAAAGFVSTARSLDVRILASWWMYTAVTGLTIIAMIAIPALWAQNR